MRPRGGRVVVVGVGNEYRRDDGVGPHVLACLRDRVPPGVELVASDGEPADLLEAWTGARLAVVVDAVVAVPSAPGRLHRVDLSAAAAAPATAAPAPAAPAMAAAVSSHGLGIEAAAALAAALGRLPDRLIVHAVEVADTGQGVGLSPEVAAAVDALTQAVLTDLTERWA
jgi:hydrogenase maturation protease